MHNTYVLPPGPRTTPWQTLLLVNQTFHFFQQCSKSYGDPFTTTISGIKTVFTGQREGIQQTFNANPNLFDTIYPKPQTFLPERFLVQQYSPYEYLPFGGGTRRCLGAAFALYEMQIVGTIMARHKLALDSQRPVTPSSLGFAISPKQKVKMVILS